MNKILLLVITVLLLGCASSFKMTDDHSDYPRTISFTEDNFELISKTPWLSNSTVNSYMEQSYVQTTGNSLLEDVLIGYSDQLPEFEYVDGEDSDIVFRIKSLSVKRGLFTFNFTHPGPLYRMIMKVEIFENGIRIHDLKLKQLVNMAEINFEDESTKWMSNEEKLTQEYQRSTFRAGLRKLYQQLYFEYLDIKLSK